MVLLSLKKYFPPKLEPVRIASVSQELEYEKYYRKIIKDYVYYSAKRIIA